MYLEVTFKPVVGFHSPLKEKKKGSCLSLYVTLMVFPSQVYVENSGSTGGLQYPFGYLKASTNLTSVNLFIMPYNYPKLIPLIGKQ